MTVIQCSFCQSNHVLNTVFCGECGEYLLEHKELETDPLPDAEIGWVVEATKDPGLSSSAHADIEPQTVPLRICIRKRKVEVPLDKAIRIGRVDPALAVFPEIDLTTAGGPVTSVSRRHASILLQGDTVALEDLGSINGTFINGVRLAPYLPETIKDGDILQLGKLLIEVKIQEQNDEY